MRMAFMIGPSLVCCGSTTNIAQQLPRLGVSVSAVSDIRFEQPLTAVSHIASYIDIVLTLCEDTMTSNHKTQPFSHLTAVHMLGRILERIDQNQHASSGSNRYQQAMQRLSQSLDDVERHFVMRDVLNNHSA